MAVTSEFMHYAMNFWEQKTQSRPTPEEVHQIAKNLCGFFEVLHEWQRTDQSNGQEAQVVMGVAFAKQCECEQLVDKTTDRTTPQKVLAATDSRKAL